jgi:hypothetical protein
MTLPESIKERVLTMGAEARRLGTTGALIGTFASGPELNFPFDLTFTPVRRSVHSRDR